MGYSCSASYVATAVYTSSYIVFAFCKLSIAIAVG